MKLLLTGAGGFIGSALLAQLQNSGLQIRALYRTLPEQLPAAVEVFSGDLCDEALCHKICEGIDIVVHLAGQAHVQSSKGSHIRNNYEISSKLAKAAVQEEVQKFIYISTTKANFPTHSHYAAVKLATEQMLLSLCDRQELQVLCLRPALVYGKQMRGNLRTLLNLLRTQTLPCFPMSHSPLGMISLEDCCRAIKTAVHSEALWGRSWELNDGQRYTLADITRQVRETLGFAMPLLQLPEFSVKLAAKLAELSSPLTGTGIGMGTYRGLYQEPYPPDDRFTRITGFVPSKTFYTELATLLESTQ